MYTYIYIYIYIYIYLYIYIYIQRKHALSELKHTRLVTPPVSVPIGERRTLKSLFETQEHPPPVSAYAACASFAEDYPCTIFPARRAADAQAAVRERGITSAPSGIGVCQCLPRNSGSPPQYLSH